MSPFNKEEQKQFGPSTSGVHTPLLDKIVSESGRRMEYLKGHEAQVGNGLKYLLYGGAGIWVATHLTTIRDFVDNIVDIQTKLIYGGALAVVMWAMWLVLSSRKFQYTVSMLVDRTIEKFHRMMVARDPQGSARFSINRLRKRINEGEEAKAKVGAAYDAVNGAAELARKKAEAALGSAKGLEKEKEDRSQGRGNPRIQLSNVQLESAIAEKKGTLRREYLFFQEEAESAAELGKRYAAIQEVLESGKVQLNGMEQDLDKSIQRWQLKLREMEAMEASGDVVDSEERRVFDQSMRIIQDQADLFSGRTRMILDRLDPTLQAHRASGAAATIADEDFYAQLANDSQLAMKPEAQERLLAASERPILPELEEMLGDATTATTGDVPPQQRGNPPARRKPPGRFDDLLGGGRRK